MNFPKLFFFLFFLAITSHSRSQERPAPAGKLFIIGGGDRTPALMKILFLTAEMGPGDYVAVLPMSSEDPDSSFWYFREDFEKACKLPIVELNFTPNRVNDKVLLDSLRKARLVYITGGDQMRFMNRVLHTGIYDAIHQAYDLGATIAGSSAGAAVMSYHMITGNQLSDTNYQATFKKLHSNNVEFREGLGLLKGAIVDQHFIVRSRYNRLLSAMAQFPRLACIGIDEITAIIVQGEHVRVVGESQVVVLRNPRGLVVTAEGLIKLKDLQFTIYTNGDEFLLQPGKR